MHGFAVELHLEATLEKHREVFRYGRHKAVIETKGRRYQLFLYPGTNSDEARKARRLNPFFGSRGTPGTEQQHGFETIANVELLHNLRHIAFDRVVTQYKLLGNFLVRKA